MPVSQIAHEIVQNLTMLWYRASCAFRISRTSAGRSFYNNRVGDFGYIEAYPESR
jgi:hypothetical protein